MLSCFVDCTSQATAVLTSFRRKISTIIRLAAYACMSCDKTQSKYQTIYRRTQTQRTRITHTKNKNVLAGGWRALKIRDMPPEGITSPHPIQNSLHQHEFIAHILRIHCVSVVDFHLKFLLFTDFLYVFFMYLLIVYAPLSIDDR